MNSDHRIDDLLARYRAETGPVVSGFDAEALWNRIEAETRPSGAAVGHRFLWLRYAAAFVVLMGGLWLMTLMFATTDHPVAVAKSQQVRFDTGTGAVVTLRPNSVLDAMDAPEGVERYRISGEAWFDVERTGRTFEVVTDAGTIRVLGTRFSVRNWKGRTRVYLAEGLVGFSNATADVVLEPGFQAETDGDTAPIRVETAPQERVTAWMREELVLDGTPMREWLAELEQHYGIELSVPDSLLDDTYTGRVILADRDRTLETIALTTGGLFHPLGDNRYRLDPDP